MQRASRFLTRCLLVTAAAGVTGASALIAQRMPFSVAYEASVYADTDSTSLVEVDVRFLDRSMTFHEESGKGRIGKLFVQILFHGTRGGDFSTDWVTAVAEPPAGTAPQQMISIQRIALPPGSYRCEMLFVDAVDKQHRDSASFDLKVPVFAGNRIQLSDMQIVSDAYPSDDPSSIFYKNGHFASPTVGAVIEPPFLTVNTYLEIYHADKLPVRSYVVKYMLSNAKRQVFATDIVERKVDPNASNVDLHAFQLDSVPSGDYFVVAQVFDGSVRAHTDSALVGREFRVVNLAIDSMYAAIDQARALQKQAPSLASAMVDPLFAGLHEDELNREFSKASLVASDPERSLWDGLTGADAKRRFLSDFWQRRDDTPKTPANEARDDYYKRAEEARNLYGTPMSPEGWKTDRGRILLQFGKPDNVERHVQDFNRKPYEVWTYSGKNFEFVFVDRAQTGSYKLVHSTAPGEVHYENWERDFTPLNKNWKDGSDRADQ